MTPKRSTTPVNNDKSDARMKFDSDLQKVFIKLEKDIKDEFNPDEKLLQFILAQNADQIDDKGENKERKSAVPPYILKKESQVNRLCLLNIADTLKKWNVEKLLSTSENLVFSLKMRMLELQRSNENHTRSALKTQKKSLEQKLKLLNQIEESRTQLNAVFDRFSLIISCATDNYNLYKGMIHEIDSNERTPDTDAQRATLQARCDFLLDRNSTATTTWNLCLEQKALINDLHEVAFGSPDEKHYLVSDQQLRHQVAAALNFFKDNIVPIPEKWNITNSMGIDSQRYLKTAHSHVILAIKKNVYLAKMGSTIEKVLVEAMNIDAERRTEALTLKEMPVYFQQMEEVMNVIQSVDNVATQIVRSDRLFQPSTSDVPIPDEE